MNIQNLFLVLIITVLCMAYFELPRPVGMIIAIIITAVAWILLLVGGNLHFG